MSPEDTKLHCITLVHNEGYRPKEAIEVAEMYADFILGTEHAKMRERLEGIEKAMQP